LDLLVVSVICVGCDVPHGVGHRFQVAVAVVGVFGFVQQRVDDLDRAALGVAVGFGCVFGFFARFDVAARADGASFLRVFVVAPRALVAFWVGFSDLVAGCVVFVFGRPQIRIS